MDETSVCVFVESSGSGVSALVLTEGPWRSVHCLTHNWQLGIQLSQEPGNQAVLPSYEWLKQIVAKQCSREKRDQRNASLRV